MNDQVIQTMGFDGKTAWANNIMQGNRVLTGGEKTNLLADTMHPTKFYDKIVLKEEKEFNKKQCYVLILSKKGIHDRTWYINKETHLQEGSHTITEGPEGKVTVNMVITEYATHKKGFKYESKMSQSMMGIKCYISVTKIEIDTKIDDSEFKRPTQ